MFLKGASPSNITEQTTNPVQKAFKIVCKNCEITSEPLLPPRVAEMRMWVPYFLMMVSMNC